MHLNQLHEIKPVPNPPCCRRLPSKGSVVKLELVQDPDSDDENETVESGDSPVGTCC